MYFSFVPTAKVQFTADLHGWTRFVTMQNHYNLVYCEEEREMDPFCRDQGVGLVPWSPLARGCLAGNRTRDKKGETNRSTTDPFAHSFSYRDEDFKIVDRVVELANKRGVKPTQIALVATAPTQRQRTDHRREQAAPSARSSRRAQYQTERRGMQVPRRAVPAASGVGT